MNKNLRLTLVLLSVSFLSFTFAQTGWEEQTNPLGFGEEAMIGKIHFVSDTEGWITCGKGGFLHTTDSGNNWIFVNPFPSDTVECFSDPSVSMSWIGTTHGWNINTIGTFDSGKGAVIYKTTNSGANWSKINLSDEDGDCGIQLQFADTSNGWALIFNFNSGAVSFLRTSDGGNTWNPFPGIGIFYFADINNGWAYTGSGQTGFDPPYKIYKTTDGGNNWTEQFSDTTAGQYNNIRFYGLNNGWVVGANGKIIKTTNGGTDWTFVTNSGVNPLESCKTVFPLDADNVWIPSKHSDNQHTPYLQHTTDGGSTWTTLTTPFGDSQGYNAIFSIHFINPGNGWVTGDYGRIAKYSGTTSVEDEINGLSDYALGQNYPNPFNPATKISYAIPSNVKGQVSNIVLKVYDVLGNEVEVLVNEEQPAGVYEVIFDGSGLSSGVYFYRIIAGSFTDTKKLVLVK